MAGATRDRVTVDLRGIGDAVRAAAGVRNTTIAALARQALVDAVGEITPALCGSSIDHIATSRSTVKLILRLPGVAAQTHPAGRTQDRSHRRRHTQHGPAGLGRNQQGPGSVQRPLRIAN
jgi:hypothetical protein